MPKRAKKPEPFQFATYPPVPLFTVAPCERCAKPCWVRESNAAIDIPLVTLRPATTAHGLCEECAAHWWMFSVDGLRWAFQDGPGALVQPQVQAAIVRALNLMHPALGTLDWTRLLAQWDLPWPDDWTLAKDG